MVTYKLKPEFEGLIIQTKIWEHSITLTLDATQPVSSEHLSNYYRYNEFRQFIDVVETKAKKYTGVETKSKFEQRLAEKLAEKNTEQNGEEDLQSPATDADSTAVGGDDTQL